MLLYISIVVFISKIEIFGGSIMSFEIANEREEVTKIKVANFLPAVFIPMIYYICQSLLGFAA